MLRRTISITAALAMLLTALLALPAPAGAQQQRDYPWYGHADVRNQVLRPGCRNYRVDYVVRPPTGEWSAIIQLYTPRNRKMGTLLLDANAPDPLRGSKPFRICRPTVRPGRFKVQMEVIYTDGRDRESALTRPRYFRLTKHRR